MTTIRNLLGHSRFLGVTMTGAYGLINGILAAAAPFTHGWATWQTTLVAVPPMVIGMVHVVVPLARRMR